MTTGPETEPASGAPVDAREGGGAPATAQAATGRDVSVTTSRPDQVRWGPIWAGTLTVLATFLLLELSFFALGWLTLDGDSGTDTVLMTGLVGVLSFLLGGLTAGATATYKGFTDGLLQGILVWVLAVTAVVLITLLGGGALFGAFSDALGQLSTLGAAQPPGTAGVPEALTDAARDTAAQAVLVLGVAVVSSAVGGVLGAKIWPRGDRARTVVR